HEALRDRQADTRGRAGDDGDLARQLATIRGVHQLSQDADGTASEASSAHRSSATGSDISALTWAMRAGSDTPTTVAVTRGSRRENCSAAAGSDTPCSAQARCIDRTALTTSSLAFR